MYYTVYNEASQVSRTYFDYLRALDEIASIDKQIEELEKQRSELIDKIQLLRKSEFINFGSSVSDGQKYILYK